MDALNLTDEEVKMASEWLDDFRVLIEEQGTKVMFAANSALFVVYFAQQTIGLNWNVILDVIVRSTKNRETVIAFYAATVIAEELSDDTENDEAMVHEITRWMAAIMAWRASVNALEKAIQKEEMLN